MNLLTLIGIILLFFIPPLGIILIILGIMGRAAWWKHNGE